MDKKNDDIFNVKIGYIIKDAEEQKKICEDCKKRWEREHATHSTRLDALELWRGIVTGLSRIHLTIWSAAAASIFYFVHLLVKNYEGNQILRFLTRLIG